jgi:hypothetical protein
MSEFNILCFVCIQFTLKPQKKNSNAFHKELHFVYKIGDEDKHWICHISCSVCVANLGTWLNGNRYAMPFVVPAVCRELKDHTSDYYFCFPNASQHKSKNKHSVKYPNFLSVLGLVAH